MTMLRKETRTLRELERDLAGSDPRLTAHFSTFTLVMRDEELPSAERLATVPVRQLRDGCEQLARAGLSLAGARLWLSLLRMLMALACALTAAGTGAAQAGLARRRSRSTPSTGGIPGAARSRQEAENE
jgi:hypothetical protein